MPKNRFLDADRQKRTSNSQSTPQKTCNNKK